MPLAAAGPTGAGPAPVVDDDDNDDNGGGLLPPKHKTERIYNTLTHNEAKEEEDQSELMVDGGASLQKVSSYERSSRGVSILNDEEEVRRRASSYR